MRLRSWKIWRRPQKKPPRIVRIRQVSLALLVHDRVNLWLLALFTAFTLVLALLSLLLKGPGVRFLVTSVGQQAGWLSGRFLLDRLGRLSKNEGALYLALYSTVLCLVGSLDCFPELIRWGFGRFTSGFANAGIWILMERLLEFRVSSGSRLLYFSFYVIFYHIASLIVQASLGIPSLFYKREHLWGSMLACLVCATLLPRFFLMEEEKEQTGFFHWCKRLFTPWHKPKKEARGIQCYVEGWPSLIWFREYLQNFKANYFSDLSSLKKRPWNSVIGELALFLGAWGASFPVPLYFRNHRLGEILRLQSAWGWSLTLLALFIGYSIGRVVKSVSSHLSPARRLQWHVGFLCLSAFGLSQVTTRFFGTLWLMPLCIACYNLYPSLLDRMKASGKDRGVSELLSSLESCLQMSWWIFPVVTSVTCRACRWAGVPEMRVSEYESYLYFFFHGYMFLFLFALFPWQVNDLMTHFKKRLTVWVQGTRKTALHHLKKRMADDFSDSLNSSRSDARKL